MRILITQDAFQSIADAVDQGKRHSMEFGGSLVALETNGEILVAYALPTGPDAAQSAAHLRTDANFQNELLNAIREQLPRLDYVGDWHVHPMWLPALSHTDLHTAERILREEGAHRKHVLLLLGTAKNKNPPIVLAFVARLNATGRLEVDEMPLECVARNSDAVVSRLGHPLPALEDLTKNDKPHEVPVRHREAQRIHADLESIRTYLHAEAEPWASDECLGAVVRKGKREAFVVFPPEYPIGAPLVFAGSLEHGPLRPIPLRYGWSSLHCLVDVVAIALRPPMRRRAPDSPSMFGKFIDGALAFMGVSTRQTPTPSNNKELHP